MKKLAAMMTIALAAATAGMNVSAAEAMSVWIDTNEAVSEDDTLKVSVQSNGEVTDGLIEITYDSDVLSIEEADIVLDEQVAMYSVNLEDETVKIAYLAENAMEQGEFVTLNFKMKSETELADAVNALEALTGTNYKEDGTTISDSEIGIIRSGSGDDSTDDGKDDGKDDSSDNGKDDGKDDSSDNGKDDGKDDSSDNGKEDDKNDSSNSGSNNKNDANNSGSSASSGSQTSTGSGNSSNQNVTSGNKTTAAGTSAKTGDNSQILIPAVAAAAAAGAFAALRYKKKGEE